jgi:hypothetical protein
MKGLNEKKLKIVYNIFGWDNILPIFAAR